MLSRLPLISTILCGAACHAATQYTYDALNRLTKVVDDDGRSITYTYDAAGNLLREQRSAPLIDPDLVGWWTFDDCNATDRSGKGNHGVVNTGVSCVNGRSGKAMQFEGGTIDVPSSASLKITRSVTLAAMVWLDSANGDGAGILQKGRTNVFWDYGLVAYKQAPGYRWNNVDWTSWPATPNPRFDGGWHLFTAVVDGNDSVRPIRLYVDGVSLPEPIRTYYGAESPVAYRGDLVGASDHPLQLGIGHPGARLIGMLDEVRIYRRALSDGEVASLAASLGSAGR